MSDDPKPKIVTMSGVQMRTVGDTEDDQAAIDELSKAFDDVSRAFVTGKRTDGSGVIAAMIGVMAHWIAGTYQDKKKHKVAIEQLVKHLRREGEIYRIAAEQDKRRQKMN